MISGMSPQYSIYPIGGNAEENRIYAKRGGRAGKVRDKCPHCEKMVSRSAWDRHMAARHSAAKEPRVLSHSHICECGRLTTLGAPCFRCAGGRDKLNALVLSGRPRGKAIDTRYGVVKPLTGQDYDDVLGMLDAITSL